MENIVYFKGVKYKIGNTVGYRPAEGDTLTQVKDLAFATEIVNDKRLPNSAEEVLKILQLAQEVGMAKVAEDGRPRVISKQIKYYRSFSGKLDAPNSAWNESCNCQIKASVLTGSKVIVSGQFKNVNAAVKVTVTNVIYDGATTGKYVVKGEKDIIVQGTNMMFIATGADADTATIQVGNGTARTLTCTESNAGMARFSWPAGLEVNDGDSATLIITSHAGIEGNDPTVNKKTVLCLAAEPTVMTVSKATSVLGDNVYCINTPMTIVGTNFPATAKVSVVFTNTDGDVIQRKLGTEEFASSDNGTKIEIAGTFVQSIATIDPSKGVKLVVQKDGDTAKTPLMTYREA